MQYEAIWNSSIIHQFIRGPKGILDCLGTRINKRYDIRVITRLHTARPVGNHCWTILISWYAFRTWCERSLHSGLTSWHVCSYSVLPGILKINSSDIWLTTLANVVGVVAARWYYPFLQEVSLTNQPTRRLYCPDEEPIGWVFLCITKHTTTLVNWSPLKISRTGNLSISLRPTLWQYEESREISFFFSSK